MILLQTRGSTAHAVPRVSDGLWPRLWPLIALAVPDAQAEAARKMVNALLFRALTGVPWTLVPDVDALQAKSTYDRWRQLGLLDQLAQQIQIRLDDF